MFVSHKHADAALASLIGKELEQLGPPGLIEAWVSGEDLTAGVDWSRQIRNGLAESHLLLLLFTTPAHTWDWCLFEVGLFMRFDAEDVSSVVCLYDPAGAPPGPLHAVQGVAAQADQLVSRFLRPLLTETWKVSDDWQRGPLVPEPDPEPLAAAAARIAAKFDAAIEAAGERQREEVYSYRPCHCIVLAFDEQDPEPADAIPAQAHVVEGPETTSSFTLALFGLHEGRGSRTWGDLVDAVDGAEQPWRRDLDLAFANSLHEQLWKPSTETLTAWHPAAGEQRAYMPILYEIARRHGDGRPVGATLILVPA